MTTWHDYEQHPDAHPERPWWRLVQEPEHFGWARTDGAETTRLNLPDYDLAHPLPAPPPRCGQVWVWPAVDPLDVDEAVLTRVRGCGSTDDVVGSWWVSFDGREEARGEHCSQAWPPPGAVLVAGPGSPWAEMGEAGRAL